MMTLATVLFALTLLHSSAAVAITKVGQQLTALPFLLLSALSILPSLLSLLTLSPLSLLSSRTNLSLLSACLLRRWLFLGH
jgi:hypothetical protein